ncbi:hypothetical protein K373_04559 [Streptomyces sp. DvalAA-21]|nr:hypothetical protein K373_04559 [Streptomyces sp. DvalAA-21]RAJ30133.1 hypothetical protein K351_05072 [Streptomyces sp. DpondAA-E10]RAJ44579.1 hypothetical protein K352_04811 [Streptomyces sp. DpondAA-A50]SCD67519.1 hypothetical protein GA0115235_105922 [Streptomyces sp. DpondAA-F4a]SCL89352.1 hypothetical protein SAMN04883147_103329 [Streptomyces sp. DpondAA-F4]
MFGRFEQDERAGQAGVRLSAERHDLHGDAGDVGVLAYVPKHAQTDLLSAPVAQDRFGDDEADRGRLGAVQDLDALRASGDASGRTLTVEVHDSGEAVPAVRQPRGESGRGLPLVDAVADRWGVRDRGPGKVVWCSFTKSGRG